LALKQAEQGDEIIVRLVELDGKPQSNSKVAFAAPIASAREVNGQEQPVGAATVSGGVLVTSFTAYQPRTFAVKLAAPPAKVAGVRSAPVLLKYDVAVASNDGTHSPNGFDGKGNALPAEMLPAQITFNDVQFRLAPATLASTTSAALNAIVARGQTLELPSGRYNRVYVLAASAEGDQKAIFKTGSNNVDLTIQDWGGFIGQWDDRQWVAMDTPIEGQPGQTEHDDYAEMTGIKSGYIKRADLAWYCTHHHNAAGENVPYGYSYLFAYPIDLQPGAKTMQLPDNNKIRILAISVSEENPEVKPVQPLYDVLPSPLSSSAAP
jgi:alpha-mannosidase